MGRPARQAWGAIMAGGAAATLPAGVVTFLFTDIAGSTRLFQRWRDAWPALLGEHDRIVTSAFSAYGGCVVSHEGDGYLAVFDRATAAVEAAAQLQRDLAAYSWPADGTIRVRVGIHTGYALPHDGGYVSLAVHQAARVVAAAHPGQVLLTEATVDALAGGTSPRWSLEPLGAHRLKDFDVPQPLFELTGPGLPSGFPPVPGVWRGANNLPLPRTSFVGRARDTEQVRSLLATSRLVTVVGPGGAGKTRLAVQVGASVLDGSGDGVWLVELATVTDAALVAAAVMRALGIEEQRNREYVDTLVDAVRERRLLLVFDNCEHLVDACAAVVDRLLTACPDVVVLATSRQPLDVDGEQLYRLPSLGLPPTGLPLTPEEALGFEAVQLFVERARAHQPSFELTDAEVGTVAAICRRLEGVPLAIELAAARLRSLPLPAIAARLDDQLALLVGSQRTLSPRQQTVRALVDWSYDLLDTDEQRLLRRLAVFAGGWSLDAATAVAGDDGGSEHAMLDRLSSLVDKSLVQAEAIGGDVRYSLLETVRQYAAARMHADEPDQVVIVQHRHRDHFLQVAEQARVELNTRAQRRWLERLDLEDGNLRAALGFTVTDTEGAVLALRFVAALSSYWVMRGRAAEGMQHADRVLAFADTDATSERAGALTGVAAMLIRSGDFARARALLDEGLRIARQCGDARRAAIALNDLAWLANRREDLAGARSLAEEALALAETHGETHLAGRIHATLGDLEERYDDLVTGRAHFEEARRRFDAAGDIVGSAKMLNNLGLIDLAVGDRAGARSALEACLAIFSELQDAASLPTVLSNLGLIAVEDGDHDRATELFVRGLRLGYRARDKELMVYTTLGLALAAGGAGDVERAATLHGIADALAAELAMSLDSLEAGLRANAQEQLQVEAATVWDEAYARGLAMDIDRAVDFALSRSTTEPAPA